jgi:hypothetical protein
MSTIFEFYLVSRDPVLLKTPCGSLAATFGF